MRAPTIHYIHANLLDTSLILKRMDVLDVLSVPYGSGEALYERQMKRALVHIL